MIEKSNIEKIVLNELDREKHFLVDLTVSTSNKIIVSIDGWDGVTIDDCVRVSRAVEGTLDREIEDFELEVTSAGLDHPFKVLQQYKKNLDKQVAVVDHEGQKTKGKLIGVNDEGFTIEESKRVKVEGKKKKQLVTNQLFFQFNQIKSTTLEISFK